MDNSQAMPSSLSPPDRPANSPNDGITDVRGILAGHFTDPRRPTGCTVLIAPDGAVGGVDVRGAAPGTRETDLLHPSNLVDRVHALPPASSTAWGLDAASGVMRWLEEQGIGLALPYGLVPIVPAAVLFDLAVGDHRIRPDARAGYAACVAASRLRPADGNFGAGAGALVGKLMGMDKAMKGGIGSASITLDGVTVGAIVACNAVGDVVDPDSGRVLAGARSEDGASLRDIRSAILAGTLPKPLIAGSNTTLAIVATDATLNKAQAHRIAQVAHDGLARSINPVHTMSDGDTVFALGTGKSAGTLGMLQLATLAAEVTARAVVRAVRAARAVRVDGQHWPAACDFAPGEPDQSP